MTAFLGYAETPSAGKAGHLAASSGVTGHASTIVRVVDADVNSALAVCNGATPGKTCKQPTTAAEAAACIGVLLDPEYTNEIGAAAEYLAGDQATLVDVGNVWVNAEGTVAYDDLVYVRHTSDGGSNTTRGTFRNNSDGTVVIDTTSTVEGKYAVTLFNGVVEERFEYDTDGSASADEIAAGLVAAIDASANYSAAGTTECTITLVAGGEITIKEIEGPTAAATALFTVTDNQKATRLKGARWGSARSGAGLAKLKLKLRQD